MSKCQLAWVLATPDLSKWIYWHSATKPLWVCRGDLKKLAYTNTHEQVTMPLFSSSLGTSSAAVEEGEEFLVAAFKSEVKLSPSPSATRRRFGVRGWCICGRVGRALLPKETCPRCAFRPWWPAPIKAPIITSPRCFCGSRGLSLEGSNRFSLLQTWQSGWEELCGCMPKGSGASWLNITYFSKINAT